MSEIKKLIERLCPDGVEFKKLGEVIVSLKTGLNPRKNFVLNEPGSNRPYITGKDIYNNRINVTERTDLITDDALKLINKRACLENGLLLFASTGTGTVGRMAIVENYQNDWAMSETLYAIKTSEQLFPKFLMYYLYSENSKTQFEPKISKGSVPHLKVLDLLNVSLPVPPLEVQSKIVEILDNFTELEAELEEKLEAELEARRKQYEYYRNQLLSFEKSGQNNVKWMALGEIGEVCMCKRILKHQTSSDGEIPFFKIGTFGGNPDAYIDRELYEEYKSKFSFPKKGDILISAAGTIGRTVIYDGKDSYFQDSNIVWIDNDESVLLNKYLFYLYRIIEWKTEGGTIKRLYNGNLKATKVAVPPLSEQERIVSILDRFEALTTDLQSGLPAEIEARRKQYEYYREQLLTFKRKTA